MSSRTRTWFLWGLSALVVLALAFGAWRALLVKRTQQQALQAQTSTAAPALRAGPSEYLRLAERTLPLQVPISGALAAVDSTVVKARTSGELQGLELREGDSVRKGQVIARVDATESEARWRQARLQADAAQAQQDIQQRQYDNNRALVDKNFISATALATSEANLQAARANHAAARAAADAARKVLDDTVLRSPIDGQIARRWVQNGERVNAEASVVEVVNLSALELQAPLPPQDSLRVQVGQNALLTVEGSAQPFNAQVVRISPSAQAGSRTVPVYLRVQPTAGIQLRPGLFVQGQIATGSVKALAVPLDAVRNDQPQPYVQLLVNGAVARQPVQLGAQAVPQPLAGMPTSDTAPWVAIEGVPAGAVVLLATMGPLPAGTLVELTAPAATPAPTAPAAIPSRPQ